MLTTFVRQIPWEKILRNSNGRSFCINISCTLIKYRHHHFHHSITHCWVLTMLSSISLGFCHMKAFLIFVNRKFWPSLWTEILLLKYSFVYNSYSYQVFDTLYKFIALWRQPVQNSKLIFNPRFSIMTVYF